MDEVVVPAMNAYVSSISEIAAYNKKELDRLVPHLEKEADHTQIILLLLLVVSVLISLMAAWFIIKGITKSLVVVITNADRIAAVGF